MTWSAAQYLAFEDERTRPVRDLLAALLAARFPNAAVSGLDSSADMIAAARKRLPKLRFEVTDIEAWIKIDAGRGPPDVILANAVLQWVPNHAAVFPSLVAKLAPAGAVLLPFPRLFMVATR
ncbi:MAG TPA: methyltransferase [Steroidobacteraceae bacterium]|nr:methyltransferase [Steroidobacteraceae bacterium]